MAIAESLDQSFVAELESVITAQMRELQVPGFSIAIVQDGEVTYAKGFGISRLGSEIPVTKQSLFVMGSMSKAFAATAILQLREAGKLSLDTLVTDVLPYFQLADERYKAICSRHLLTHTSGLAFWPPIEDWDFVKYWDKTIPELDDQALERYVRSLHEVSLDFAPGEGYGYSDAAYNVAADVVAKVSGQLFEEYARDHILTPLGMKNSSFLLREVDPKLLVSPHHSNQMGEVVVSRVFPYTRAQIAAGYLITNAEDMARWALANLNRGTLDGARILNDSTYDELWKDQLDPALSAPQGLDFGFGAYSYGWAIEQRGEHPIVGHGGVDLGFCANIQLAVADRVGIVAMANRFDGFGSPALALEMANIAMKRLLGLEE